MTFQEAVVSMVAGNTVYRASIPERLFVQEDGAVLIFNEGNDVLDAVLAELGVGDYTATDWEVFHEVVALPELDIEVEMFAYKHPVKNRWVSTTNPQKHLDDGHDVDVFVRKQVI